jgi:hypothetical protein
MLPCSVDGLVIMSSLSLVLDGILTEPPPLALPPSATAAGSAATAAATSVSFGSSTMGSGGDATSEWTSVVRDLLTAGYDSAGACIPVTQCAAKTEVALHCCTC